VFKGDSLNQTPTDLHQASLRARANTNYLNKEFEKSDSRPNVGYSLSKTAKTESMVMRDVFGHKKPFPG
jgi:hypothetical protein